MGSASPNLRKRLGRRSALLLGFLLSLWTVQVVNELTNHGMDGWGVVPRSVRGLAGIPISPFIHGSWKHLILNSIPLLVLGGLVVMRGSAVFIELTAFVALLGGTGVWLFADLAERTESSHIGASGVIFGYFGFLVASGWYDRSALAVLEALVAIVLYGSVIFSGVVPANNGVSWEGHLFGLLAGILAARAERPGP